MKRNLIIGIIILVVVVLVVFVARGLFRAPSVTPAEGIYQLEPNLSTVTWSSQSTTGSIDVDTGTIGMDESGLVSLQVYLDTDSLTANDQTALQAIQQTIDSARDDDDGIEATEITKNDDGQTYSITNTIDIGQFSVSQVSGLSVIHSNEQTTRIKGDITIMPPNTIPNTEQITTTIDLLFIKT